MEKDYKNESQAASDWNVSKKTVIRYCEQGMVPFAEKVGVHWEIPKDAEKPMMTRGAAVHMMYYLTVYSEGGKPNLSRTGISKDLIENGYPYLVDIGYITELNEGDTLKEQLKDVTITSLGKALIDAENADRKRRGETEITGRLRLSAGIVEAEVEEKYKN